MNIRTQIEAWKNQIWYEWMKFDVRYGLWRIGHFEFDDSYRFYCFILLPDQFRGDYHLVIREYETFLVWRIGKWFLVIDADGPLA